MKIMTFDLEGFMAHFRKFYTNSSSLSYQIPPRTTILGIIGGILGYSYEETVEKLKNASIGVKINSPLRFIIQKVNYLDTSERRGFWGDIRRTQVPIEFIMPQREKISYRIFFYHQDEGILNELFELLSNKKYRYPPYLGITECIGWIENAKILDFEFKNTSQKFEISTAIPLRKLNEIELKLRNKIFKDIMPISLDKDRNLEEGDEIIWDANGIPILASIKEDLFYIVNENIYGVFL